MAKEPFALIYAPQTKGHFRSIDRKYHTLIRQSIETMLLHEPLTESTNRKPLRTSVIDADWKIRFGPGNRFRVFYAVDTEAHEVRITAVGVKDGNRIIIAGEELEQ